MAGTLRIHLLGTFRLLHNDVPLTSVDTPRLQSFLAYLLLHRDAPQPRQHLSFLFWPDSTEAQARTNLRKTLYHLRQALPDADDFIHADNAVIHWQAADRFTLDVTELEHALEESEQARQAGRAAAQQLALDRAVSLYAGELLPGCYDDWVLPERERLHQRAIAALAALAELLEGQRAYEEAIGHVQHLIRLDPLHEAGYRQLMRLLALQGNRAAAIRTYHACATVLQEELGVTPAVETQRVYHRLLELDAAESRPAPSPAGGSDRAGEFLSAWPLIGRDAAWGQLQAAWHETGPARRHLVLLTGEAGIGKTRLAEEFVVWARRQGLATTVARCYTSAQALAYGPVADWLRSPPLDQALRRLDPVWLTELARLLPEILVDCPQVPPPQAMTEPWQRQRLFEALALPFDAPPRLVLLLDDVHWADHETLEWLSYLLHRTPRSGESSALFIVATAREEDLPDRPRLQALIEELRRSGQLAQIELGPLTGQESRALAAVVAGKPLSAQIEATLYHETEGNPLFVVETVRAALDDTQNGGRAAPPVGEQASLPPAVHAAVLSRLAHLSPEARDLAGVAATLGRQFTFDVLAHAASRQGEPIADELLVRALDELWQRRIVRQSGATHYDFTHDKIRQVVYGALSPVRRRHLHTRVAAALAAVPAPHRDALSGQIAAHYERGGRFRDAVDHYRHAAAVARQIYANDEAINIYRYLLEPARSASLPLEDRAAILVDLGEVWQLTGDWPAADDVYRQALTIAEEVGSTALVARCHLALGNLVRLQGAYADALDWLTRARDGFESCGDMFGLVRALWATGEVYWYTGDHTRALAALERQMDIARTIDDRRGMCDAAGTMGIIHWSLGDFERARSLCRRSIEIAEGINHWWGVGRALITLGNTYNSQGDLAAAFVAYEQAFEVASQIGDRQCKSWAVASIGDLYGAAGQHQAALAHYQHTLRVGLDIGDLWSVSIALASIAETSAELGDTTRAEQLFHKAIHLARALGVNYLGEYLLGLAQFYESQDRLDRARHYNDQALHLASETGSEHMAGQDVQFSCRLLDIRLRYRLGDIDGAAADAELTRMLSACRDDDQRALVHYEMWRLAPADGSRRDEAARLYRALAPGVLRGHNRRRYVDVTGDTPPSPPPLPDRSSVSDEPDGEDDAGTWLPQVDALLARLAATE